MCLSSAQVTWSLWNTSAWSDIMSVSPVPPMLPCLSYLPTTNACRCRSLIIALSLKCRSRRLPWQQKQRAPFFVWPSVRCLKRENSQMYKSCVLKQLWYFAWPHSLYIFFVLFFFAWRWTFWVCHYLLRIELRCLTLIDIYIGQVSSRYWFFFQDRKHAWVPYFLVQWNLVSWGTQFQPALRREAAHFLPKNGLKMKKKMPYGLGIKRRFLSESVVNPHYKQTNPIIRSIITRFYCATFLKFSFHFV